MKVSRHVYQVQRYYRTCAGRLISSQKTTNHLSKPNEAMGCRTTPRGVRTYSQCCWNACRWLIFRMAHILVKRVLKMGKTRSLGATAHHDIETGQHDPVCCTL